MRAGLAARSLGVLLAGYRGYGGDLGRPDKAGLGRDILAAYRYLTGELRVPSGRLLYFGERLGPRSSPGRP